VNISLILIISTTQIQSNSWVLLKTACSSIWKKNGNKNMQVRQQWQHREFSVPTQNKTLFPEQIMDKIVVWT